MIVIGGSLGGGDALRAILRGLPKNFSMPIAVVLHRHRDGDELLLPFIQRNCVLPVKEAEDKDPIEAGHVYLGPPDYHLLLEEGCFSLSTDDLVNFARPSIDALFESAAEWMATQAVAVVLSGGGFDGAAGVRKIEEKGGTVIVQDPKTADGSWMPAAAIDATKAPKILPLDQIALELVRLSALGR